MVEGGKVMDFLSRVEEGVMDCFHDICHIIISIFIVTVWQQGSHLLCSIIMVIPVATETHEQVGLDTK